MGRELARGGQVYYLHNRVESIVQAAARIKSRFPDAEVAVAHGKMDEEQLGDVMQRMADGEIQILVCTTIIETGIDIPNVNTLIIEDADKLGLAQLHQIRGRVGRSSRHAYAYLTFRKGKVLSEVAEKRLTAIREFAEFGSGFKIAMRDLEIRGAGDLLGAEQSGHMLSVGYDMYLKLLEEAVLEERGEARPQAPECTADLAVSANIDKSYVPAGEQRMDLYRRMAAIRTEEDSEDLIDEIVDRYGDPPKAVMNLVAIALLRAGASAAGIQDRAEGRSIADHHGAAQLPGGLGGVRRGKLQAPDFLLRRGKAHADLAPPKGRGSPPGGEDAGQALCPGRRTVGAAPDAQCAPLQGAAEISTAPNGSP